jgi:hypothetical protein
MVPEVMQSTRVLRHDAVYVAARPLLVMQGADIVYNLQLLSQLGIRERELAL